MVVFICHRIHWQNERHVRESQNNSGLVNRVPDWDTHSPALRKYAVPSRQGYWFGLHCVLEDHKPSIQNQGLRTLLICLSNRCFFVRHWYLRNIMHFCKNTPLSPAFPKPWRFVQCLWPTHLLYFYSTKDGCANCFIHVRTANIWINYSCVIETRKIDIKSPDCKTLCYLILSLAQILDLTLSCCSQDWSCFQDVIHR